MAKRQLKAKQIEKLENTSFASVLGEDRLVQGDEQTFSFGSCDTCGDSCGCPATNTCPSPTETCPSINDPAVVSVGSTACCDALVQSVRSALAGNATAVQ